MNRKKIISLLQQVVDLLTEDDKTDDAPPKRKPEPDDDDSARAQMRARMHLPPLGKPPAAIRTGPDQFSFSAHNFAQSRSGGAK